MSNFSSGKGYQAFRILQVAFVVAPILAGLDKFFYLLTNWSKYLSPFAMNLIHGNDRVFMCAIGVVEIIAGIGTLVKPRIFAYIISLWLLCSIINLLMTRQYLDVVLRDIGLMLAAVALGRLSQEYEKTA